MSLNKNNNLKTKTLLILLLSISAVTFAQNKETFDILSTFPKRVNTIVITTLDTMPQAFKNIQTHLVDYGFSIEIADEHSGIIRTAKGDIDHYPFKSTLTVTVQQTDSTSTIEIRGNASNNGFDFEALNGNSKTGVNTVLFAKMYEVGMMYINARSLSVK
ncbi:MAG: hypothetical protein IPL55_13275 [Saprospiraceae bacterium]|jgi:hypothetical protein|nr:hypothetical protein [Saprospiraceae bacterium]MBL0024363.1 hypothetical protein [Saprospiraceae bacterium]